MDPVALALFLKYASMGLELVDAGTTIVMKLKALQDARTASGKQLTVADLEAEFSADDLEAAAALATIVKAQAAKDASKTA